MRASSGPGTRILVVLVASFVSTVACLTDETMIGKPCVENEDCEVPQRHDQELACKDGICTASVCGNGVREATEECDDANLDLNDACVDCELARCGDGVLWFGMEECDDANQVDEDACLANCMLNTCGDGLLDPAAEECDDGNEEDGDGCSSACQLVPPMRRGDAAVDRGSR
ncbi:MAG: DUF4215 domain-containing protein [Myxococcales bacterium]|nr:DUF4215 domain-containing protein [Myxococcales bacterium]MCB9718032.1 DUF4215 domain-containing protein [Myxococcales bacterium]